MVWVVLWICEKHFLSASTNRNQLWSFVSIEYELYIIFEYIHANLYSYILIFWRSRKQKHNILFGKTRHGLSGLIHGSLEHKVLLVLQRLQTLLDTVFSDKPHCSDDLFLTNPMRALHSLKLNLWDGHKMDIKWI